jgi:hypothetical protein
MTTDTIIAGSALALSLYGIYATNRHNRLSVVPHVFGGRSSDIQDNGLMFSYDIFNHGIGPAKITNFALLTKGKPLSDGKGNRIERWIQDHVGDRLKYQFKSTRNLGSDTSLLPGETNRIIQVFFPGATPADMDEIERAFDGLDIRIEYTCFYGHKFVFDTSDK